MHLELLLVILIVAIYLLCGMIFCWCFLLNYKPADRTALLGLMALFWPIMLVLDLGHTLVHGFGRVVKLLYVKGRGK